MIVTNVNGTCWSRVLARCCAVAMGTVIGVFYCMAAIRLFFVRGVQTWPGFLAWVAAVLALAFIALLGFLMFGPSLGPTSDRPAISQQSELPAPGVPNIPTPAPPKPQ